MKSLLKMAAGIFKTILVCLVLMEIVSFLVISISNYIIYGKVREGSRVSYDPYALFLNREGQRPTAYNASEPGGNNVTIWMFGGSTMRGSTDFDERTIPSFLARALNEKGGDLRFTALNFGEDSFNSLLETKYFQKVMIEHPEPRPNVIVFYDGANDCSYFTQHRTPYAHHGYRRMRGLIESYHQSLFGIFKPLNAALYVSFTKELYDKIIQVFVPVEIDSDSLRRLLDQTEQRYDYLNSQAAAQNAVFILFWQPVLWVETGEAAFHVREIERKHFINTERFKTMRRNFEAVYGAISDRLQNKPYFVSLRNVLCSRTEPAYKPDGVHLNDDGRTRIAEAMRVVLEERLGLSAAHEK
ncbi:MAG: SGNH/GDSL hydrolase family protein [Syntrophobacteraceae bacterium]|jgi:lysophospholipase L1-like esterase